MSENIKEEFIESESPKEITKLISGKKVLSIKVGEETFGDYLLKIYFKDNSCLSFRYDWMYDWKFERNK